MKCRNVVVRKSSRRDRLLREKYFLSWIWENEVEAVHELSKMTSFLQYSTRLICGDYSNVLVIPTAYHLLCLLLYGTYGRAMIHGQRHRKCPLESARFSFANSRGHLPLFIVFVGSFVEGSRSDS